MEYITMRNGTKVPMLGLGCYKSEEQEGVEAVKSAIEIGYRHIDTANFYENEKYVGRGIRESGIDREKGLFVIKPSGNRSHLFILRRIRESCFVPSSRPHAGRGTFGQIPLKLRKRGLRRGGSPCLGGTLAASVANRAKGHP